MLRPAVPATLRNGSRPTPGAPTRGRTVEDCWFRAQASVVGDPSVDDPNVDCRPVVVAVRRAVGRHRGGRRRWEHRHRHRRRREARRLRHRHRRPRRRSGGHHRRARRGRREPAGGRPESPAGGVMGRNRRTCRRHPRSAGGRRRRDRRIDHRRRGRHGRRCSRRLGARPRQGHRRRRHRRPDRRRVARCGGTGDAGRDRPPRVAHGAGPGRTGRAQRRPGGMARWHLCRPGHRTLRRLDRHHPAPRHPGRHRRERLAAVPPPGVVRGARGRRPGRDDPPGHPRPGLRADHPVLRSGGDGPVPRVARPGPLDRLRHPRRGRDLRPHHACRRRPRPDRPRRPGRYPRSVGGGAPQGTARSPLVPAG